ncbi:MAG: hypothetical protein EB059_00050 [Alphaproteobacteria bacterium]|nr:hypothetical protein [Alphaproteobacteria bacterium]
MRGLALANAKPAFGFDHFQITAHAIQTFYPQTKPVLIIRESKRADLFCAWLNADHTIENYFLSTAQDILEKLPADCLITGNGAAPLLALNPSLHMLDISDTRFMQSLAQLTQRADPAQHSSPQPLYLREADVTAPKPLAHTA